MTARAHLAPTGLLPVLAVLSAPPGCVCAGFECSGDDVVGLPPAPDDDDDTGEGGLAFRRSCDVLLRFTPAGAPADVEVAGEWTDWEPRALRDPDGDGVWEALLGALPPGAYAHKFLLDGQWEGPPPADVYGKWVDGTENRALYVADCMVPALSVVSATASPDGALRASLHLARAADDAALEPDSIAVTVGDRGVAEGVAVAFDAAEGSVEIEVDGLPPGKHTLRATARDVLGRPVERDAFVPLWVEDAPFRWEDGLIYFAFTDRFRDGDVGGRPPGTDGVEPRADWSGGDLRGVTQAIEEGWLDALGANVLWLTPPYDNPDGAYAAADGQHDFTGFHGYWPVDPLRLEEQLGDADATAEEAMDALIAAAHARGTRVLFDLVLNHVHEDHPYVAEHPEWFANGCVCGAPGCGWEERARDCWFMPYLPDLDYRNHAIVERAVADTLALVRRYDVDGVRVDAAKHMDHVVMRTLRQRLRDELEAGGGAEVYLVGETFAGGDGRGQLMEYVGDGELSGQFDFPLYWTIRSVFAGDAGMRELEGAMLASRDAYGDAGPRMSPFLGNHDVPRFATEAARNGQGPWGETVDWIATGGDEVTQWDLVNRQSMAFAFLFTQPGLPLLYYGDEVGLAGDGDPDNRRLMPWGERSANQEELLARVRALGTLRRDEPALRRGWTRPLWADDDVLAYARNLGGGVAVFVVLNKGWGPRTVAFAATGVEGVEGRTFVDALHPERVVVVTDGALTVSLGSWESAVLVGE